MFYRAQRCARIRSLATLAVGAVVATGLTLASGVSPAEADTRCASSSGIETCVFSIPSPTSWTVPVEAAGSPIEFTAVGQAGQEGTGGATSAPGGRAARVQASFVLPGGAVLDLRVPGATSPTSPASAGSGGPGWHTSVGQDLLQAGAGGGAAVVQYGATRLLVAGGGGGGGMPGVQIGSQNTFAPGGSGGDAGLLGVAATAGQSSGGQWGLPVDGGRGGGGATTAPGAGPGGAGGTQGLDMIGCTPPWGGAAGTAGSGAGGGSAAIFMPPLRSGMVGGGGGGGWAGGGAGGQGAGQSCTILVHHRQDFFYGGGGGGGGGSSYVDPGAVAGTASSSLTAGQTYASGGQVQIRYRLRAPMAALAPVRSAAIGSSGPVDHVDVGFDTPVTGLTAGDFSLTRNGQPLSLSAAVLAGGGQQYTLSALVGATAGAGSYVLTLRSDPAVVDASGTPITSASTSFVVT